MSRRKIIQERMQELNISPQKSLGQNFLVSDQIIDRIVSEASKHKDKSWIEVGPGLGALTDLLREQVQQELQLVEFDVALVNYWRDKGFSVQQGDALKLNWKDFLDKDSDYLLVSNLPYQIGSPLLIHVSTEYKNISSMVLMFQKEVAERICAEPRTKDYGLLSVIAQHHWLVEKVCDASPKDFYPSPKVASRVLRFRRQKTEIDGLEQKFLRFVKACFQFRRKFLLKNLRSYNSEVVASAISELGINEKARAEELSVEQFVALFEKINGN